ncbi:MAG: hypothetical protein K2Q01_04435 [Rickettsiales bacterium]|nr:hypothetical protein [Rickettsiales bacterium]
MKLPVALSTLRLFAVLIPLVASGCGLGENAHPSKPHTAKHTKIQEEHVSAQKFVGQLSLARLELAERPADVARVQPRLNLMKAYAAQARASEMLTLAVVEYMPEGKSDIQQAVAVISLKDRDFPALGEVMRALEHARMHGVRVITTQVAPDAHFMPRNEPLALKAMLDAQHRRLLSQYGKPALPEELMTQVALTEYFTAHGYRDAAYLSLENSKQLLAKAQQAKALDSESLATVSQLMERLAASLRRELPFRI